MARAVIWKDIVTTGWRTGQKSETRLGETITIR